MTIELPKERLATTDSDGRRVYLYPASVRGYFQARRLWVHSFLLILFLVTPWLHWQGKQLLLLDVARREFFFFGLHLRAHDAPYLVLLLLSFVFFIGYVTARWGRLWCGWACPQTVFTELVYRRIEKIVEGGPRERRELDQAPWSLYKVTLKGIKWCIFLLFSLICTNSFLAYFVGSKALIQMIMQAPTAHWASFLVVVVTTAIILFDFGWFREQFCIIACPYGRFQSVLLDDHSQVVGYDTKRGEPRRAPGIVNQGSCISCQRCVQVCPTGIDIRRGLQMECIACTACIDACDEVMIKTNQPKGLIRYTTLSELSGLPKKTSRPRLWIYFSLFLLASVALVVALADKKNIEVQVLRAKGLPYEQQLVGDRSVVINHFRLEISNQTGKEDQLLLSVSSEAEDIKLLFPFNPLALPIESNPRVDFFIQFSGSILKKGAKKVQLQAKTNSLVIPLEVTLVGPAID